MSIQRQYLKKLKRNVLINVVVFAAAMLLLPQSLGGELASLPCDAQKNLGLEDALICKILIEPRDDDQSAPPSTDVPADEELAVEQTRTTTGLQTFQCRFSTLSNQDNASADGRESRWKQEVMNTSGVVVVVFSQETCVGCRAIKKRLQDICLDTQQRAVEQLLQTMDFAEMVSVSAISAASEATCSTFPDVCDLLNTASPKFPNVKFVIVESDDTPTEGLFNDQAILFTPTLIVFDDGEKIFRVSGANVDCFELAARIANAWRIQPTARTQIARAIAGQSLCTILEDTTALCRIDRECQRKLKKLLQQLSPYASSM
ncbi:MAG: thioredoxin family protein [bacterium]|nr:thioredoxin family protein [bacterium]